MPLHPALTNYKPTPTAPTQKQSTLPTDYTRFSNVTASYWVWNLLWTPKEDRKCLLPIVDTALFKDTELDFPSTSPVRWLFTNSKNEVLKKSKKKMTMNAFFGRLVGLANAGTVRVAINDEMRLASKLVCHVYLSTGKVVPMDVNEISALLNAQYNGGGHSFLDKVLAITANVRGAATRGRVRLQNAMRLVDGVGKPVCASYRLVPLGTLKDSQAASASPSSLPQRALGRLLSRDKKLNKRLDNHTNSLIKRIEYTKGVKVFAIVVDFLVEEPPSTKKSDKYQVRRPRSSAVDEEEDGWVWQGEPRIWFERVVDIEFAPIPNKVAAVDEEGRIVPKVKRKKRKKFEKGVGGDAEAEASLTSPTKQLKPSTDLDAPPLGTIRSSSAPTDEKKSLLERTGLKVKQKMCCGEFCGYDSGEETLIIKELSSSNSHSKGASAAIKVAKKAAKDAREGARRMRMEKQNRERDKLVRLGLVSSSNNNQTNYLNDLDEEEADYDSDLERELAEHRMIQSKAQLNDKPTQNLAMYKLGYKSISAAKEDQRSELTLEATWSRSLRHWWKRMGMADNAPSKTKALLVLNPKKNCFFSAGDRLAIRWACHGDIQRVNVELHRDVARGMGVGGKRMRSLVISSHRPMATGIGISRGNLLWRIPKDYDRTGEEKFRRNHQTLGERERRMRKNRGEDDTTFWDDEDSEEERMLEEESFQEKYGRWRVVVTASSGAEKGVVFSVSDMFYIAPKSHDPKVNRRKNQQMIEVEDEESEEFQVQAWGTQLSRRSNNSAFLDNMFGRVMGVDEDDLYKCGAMTEFYRDVDVCAGCYKQYRILDKRREKMRTAARQHNKIHPQAISNKSGEDGVIGAGSEGILGGGQVHGRGLKTEEVWEALGYGRQKRGPDKEVVKKQQGASEKLSIVPAHRDLRKIKLREQRRKEVKERRRQASLGVNEPQLEREYDEDGNPLKGVNRLIKRIEKRSHNLAKAKGDKEKKALLVSEDNGFVQKIDKIAKREKKNMKKLKLELEEEEDKLTLAKHEHDVLGGMNWDEAVKKFRGGKDARKKNVAKMATKVEKVIGGGVVVGKKKGGQLGKGGSLKIKMRGPNVGLMRAKEVKVVKKNHWDRLLHPWQRELEQEKRDMRKEEMRRKNETKRLKNQVDKFFDVEMERQLGRQEEEIERVADRSFQSMHSSESEYWEEHWRKVYEEKIKDDDRRREVEDERVKAEEQWMGTLQNSPKRGGGDKSGMFEDIGVGQEEYEMLKRKGNLEQVEREVQESEKFFEDILGKKVGGWVGGEEKEEEEEEEEEESSEEEISSGEEVKQRKDMFEVHMDTRLVDGEEDDESEGDEDDEELMWQPSHKTKETIERERAGGDEESEVVESSEEGEDDEWEWKPKTAEEGTRRGEYEGGNKEDEAPRLSDFFASAGALEIVLKGNDGGSDREEEGVTDDDDDDEGVDWAETVPKSREKGSAPPTEEELRESFVAITKEHKREKFHLEQQLNLEQQRQQARLMARRLSVGSRQRGREEEDEEVDEGTIIAREKAHAIEELQALTTTIDKEKYRQKEELRRRVMERKASLVKKIESGENGRGEVGTERSERGQRSIQRHLLSKREQMEAQENELRAKLEKMMMPKV